LQAGQECAARLVGVELVQGGAEAPGSIHLQLLLELMALLSAGARATFGADGYQEAVAVLLFVYQDDGSD